MREIRGFVHRWRGLLAAGVAVAAVAATAVALSANGPVAVAARRPESPAVSGRYVVWSDRASGSFDIMLCDTATGVSQAIASSSADEIQPAICGERVVYVGYAAGSADIYCYDIVSGTTRMVCNAAGDQVAPSIWGDTVVWEDYRSGYQPGIYGYDLAGGYEFLVESGYNRPKKRPQAAGSLIVWEDYSGQATGRFDADIRVLNRATGAYTTVAGTSINEMVPATDGRFVVWAQAADTGMDIVAYDTSTGRTFIVRRQAGEQSQPAVGSGTAYWIDNSTGQVLHIDAFSLTAGRAVAFDTRGVGEVAGVDAQGGSVVWLERNAGRWQVRAQIGAGPLPTGLGMAAPARTWNPLRLPLARFRDRISPALASASVREGATSVRADSFTLTFTESLDADAARGGVTLTDSAGKPVASEVTYSAGSRTVTVRPRVRLAAGTYALQVSPEVRDRSGNPIGETPPLTFSTGPVLADTTPPSAPGKPFARVSGLTSVSISWNAAVDYGSGVSTYTVWRAQYVTQTPTQVATVSSSVTSATFAKVSTETLPAKYSYYYAVRAMDASGNVGAYSAWSSPDPHGTYISGQNIANCTNCHSPHGASPSGALGAKKADACYYCHGNTVTTPQFGWGSTYDTQGGFGDDGVIATTGPSVSGTRWVHRNAYMASIGRECDACHTPHRAAATRTANGGYNLLLRTQLTTPSATYRYNNYAAVSATVGPVGNRLCLDCHGDGATDDANTKITIVGGSTAYANAGGDHRTGWTPSLNLHADTSKVPSTSSNPGIQCTACHDNHGGKVPRLLGTYDATAAVSKIGARTLTGNNPTVCLACHSSAISAYSRNASGYPLTGRWPGEATYAVAFNPSTHMGSMHGTATANVVWPSSGLSTGDCKNCHVMHGAANPLDILRGGTTTTPNYSASTFAFCFTCHDGSPASTDMKRYFPVAAGGTAAQSAFGGPSSPGTRFGHRTLSPGTLAAGSALPCYDCHNPHGSTSPYGLLVVTRHRGATVTIGDSTGEIQVTGTPSAQSVRRFCFGCHGSAESTSTWGWDGSTMATLMAGDVVEGISRTTYNANGSHLKIPPVGGHYAADSQSRYTCHGRDYTGATTNNVHNPSPGISNGGSRCYDCHTSFKETMDAAGTQKTNAYHHVMGTSTVTYTGDIAPGTGTYPNSTSDLYCVTCHVDHNYFNSNRAFNLRASFTSTTTTNTDFSPEMALLRGACFQCHFARLTKDTNQKSDGSTQTLRVSLFYANSAHQYEATSTYSDASVFRANCSKCHNDEQVKAFQTPADRFSVHFSAARRLVSAFGIAVTDPLGQQHCFGCHSLASEGRKTTAGKDFYAAANMTARAEGTQRNFSRGGSSHPVTATGGAYVACEACHNPHASTAATPAVNPDNTYGWISYQTAADKNAFCLKCHDGGLPVAISTDSTYVPTTTIPAARLAISDKAANQGESHWVAHDSISSAETQTCGFCHDNHGSAAPKLLGAYQTASNVNTIGAFTVTANDNRVCQACHNAKSTGFPAQAAPSLTASYYPTDGSWPGFTTFTVSPHSTATVNVRWPDFPPATYVSGDCKQCHDVHGTANPYDELRGTPATSTYTASTFTFCFTCHDGSPASDNIKAKYPAAAGGTSSDARSGHRTISTTGTVLPGNASMPCYACHNPHGSAETTYGLQVVTRSGGATIVVGDSAGEINVGTAVGIRRFCFTCHTTASGNSGWNGSAMTSVVAGDRAMGFDRFSQGPVGATTGPHLRLPNVNGHYHYDSASCLQCHADPHQPTGGISNGGSPCYGCHTAFKETMDMAGTQKTNAYHHVVGSSTVAYTGDIAPSTGNYPTSNQDVYCVSCHTDHNYFNGSTLTSPAANLRVSITNVSGAIATNTDFITSGTYGICVSCHGTLRTKDTTNQKSDGTSLTPVISGSRFTTSVHSYEASSYYGSAVFRSNCSKCHNDEQAKTMQTSTNRFGTHWSAARRLLSAFGAGVTDPLEEKNCYGCHSGGVEGTDYYGDAYMSLISRATKTQFEKASHHPVEATQTGGAARIMCENCHNPHTANATTMIVNPDNTYIPAAYSTPTERANFCLACHDSAGPVATLTASVYIPTSIASTMAGFNKSTYAARAHWSAYGSISSAEQKGCRQCHAKHGSVAPKLLGWTDPLTNTNKIGTITITANNNDVCYGCHGSKSTSFPGTATASFTASGYPSDGTWPGKATFAATYSPTAHTGSMHGTSVVNVLWPDNPTAWASGDCKNCHDVHGTANTYDVLRGAPATSAFTPAQFGFCLTCHDGSPASDDIKSKYPVAAQGTSSDSRAGHKTISAGILPMGSAVPCYACHNPHGSPSAYGLQVVTQVSAATTIVIGDAAGEINMTNTRTANDVRRFCLSCHTTAAGASGWGGSSLVSVTAGAKVLGIDRTVQPSVGATTGPHLRLPNVTGHYAFDTDKNCYTCHQDPHQPTGGVSNGGSKCYLCHTKYRDLVDMAGTQKADYYHHVLGTSTVDYTGDQAPGTGTYPTSTQDVFCVSCHTDHNYFNGSTPTSPAANLRTAITAAGSSATNTDFFNAGTYGICTSCHGSTLRTKDTTNQMSDGSTYTPVISGQKFGMSAHQYSVQSSYGVSIFNANCVKCHNEPWAAKEYQTSNFRFGLHYAPERNLLSALGVPIFDPLEEAECYRCHTADRTPGNDFYGKAAMTRDARSTQLVFSKTSRHPVEASTTVPGGSSTTTVTTALYATTASDTANKFGGDDNSLGATQDDVATSTVPPFEMWHSFTWPSDWTSVVDATITVRSQAHSGWGATVGGNVTSTVLPDDGAPHANNFTKNGSGNVLNDVDDSTYYYSTTQNLEGWASLENPSFSGNATTLRIWIRAQCTGNDNMVIGYYTAGNGEQWNGSTTIISTTPDWYYADFSGTWSAAQLASLEVAFRHIRQGGTDEIRILEAYAEAAQSTPVTTNDDTWAIQYSTNAGSSWSTITAANTNEEASLTEHSVSLTSILTTVNAPNFRVRVRGAVVGVADNAGKVDWDLSRVDIRYRKTTTTPGTGGGPKIGCESCHNVHAATATTPVVDPDNTYTQYVYSTADQKVAFCLRCHNGSQPVATTTAGTYIPISISTTMAGFVKSTYATRGHWSAWGAISAGERKECTVCHDKHGSQYPKLLGVYRSDIDANQISSLSIAGNDNSVCSWTCHTFPSSSFPATVTGSRNASGYPEHGAWPGPSTYMTVYSPTAHTGSMHGTSVANVRWPDSPTAWASGDCKNCHDVHGTANSYDELRGTASTSAFSTSQFGFCFACHDGSPASDDTKSKYPVTAQGTSTDARSGHRTISAGLLPADSAMPCYACHQPHGSAAAYGLLVVTQMSNVATIALGDDAGEFNMTNTRTAADVRRFCFACHTTASGQSGWNGSAMASVTAGARVLGIDRTVQPSVGATTGPHLRLPNVNGHYHFDTADCLQCHADPHQPTGGISNGGSACYSCHTAYKETMDGAGIQKLNAYHHVMGTSTVTYTGDLAPGTGTYPTSNQDVFCVSCHTDHNYFNGSTVTSPAANLRVSITNASGAVATNTDFLTTGTYGICVSCHSTVRTKDLASQKSDGRNAVQYVEGSEFSTSTHSYNATSAYGPAQFRANCVKCHNDEQTKQFQTSSNKFGTHWSAERRILSALGGTLVDPLMERSCFRCHNGTTTDYYGVASMSVADRSTQLVFSKASTHPVAGNAAGSRVECINCHNPHEVSDASKISSPTNTYLAAAWATKNDKTQFCMSCHNGTVPSSWSATPSLVPTPVVIGATKTAKANKATYQAEAHWIAHDSISAGEIQTCDDCHDKHGSAAPKLLGSYQAASNVNTIGALIITANDGRVCQGCHNAASTGFPAQAPPSLTASAYPTDGSWPGFATYTSVRGIHGTSTASVLWPDLLPNPFPSGDCNQCHEVHGTANPLDALRGTPSTSTYTNASYTFCFTCHDGSPSVLDIKAKYPATVGGTSADARSGHRTISTTGTVLAGNSAIPCYACHNPHGSGETTWGLQVVTQYGGTTVTVGDGVGELNLGTAAGVRNFCFTCHTTASGNSGWNGSAMTSVTVTDRAMGFNRFYQGAVGATTGPHLRLPNVNGHYHYDTSSCLGCHSDPHQPTGGGSNGGMPCFGCHPYQVMTSTNAGRTSWYHHVLDDATPDQAPGTGAYPTSTSVLACVSCHTDHNYFNAVPVRNLRQGIGLAGSNIASSDVLPTSPYGICLSCHSSAVTRDVTNQKPGSGTNYTMNAINPVDYLAGAHNYSVNGTIGSANFLANCSKCHDDENTGSKASGSAKFGLHYSAEATLLAAMGVSVNSTGTSYPNLCYLCHGSGNPNLSKRRDYYDSRTMTQTAIQVQQDFARTYKHVLARERHSDAENTAAGWNAGTTRHATCMDCHDVHAARSGATSLPSVGATRAPQTAAPLGGAIYGVWGVTITGSSNGTWTGAGTTLTPTQPTYSKVTTISYEWQLCLKCHSRYAWSTAATPTVSQNMWGSTAATATQTDVGKDFNPARTSFHPLFEQGMNQPALNANSNWASSAGRKTGANGGLANCFTDGWTQRSLVTCSDCHGSSNALGSNGPHGSDNRWILRGANPGIKITWFTGAVNYNTAASTYPANFCINCHRHDVYINAATYRTLSRWQHDGCSRVPNIAGYTTKIPDVGCYHCHGVRPNGRDAPEGEAAAFNPANGQLHGTSARNAANRTPMGYRMTNGATWGLSHAYEDLGAGLPDGATNCRTIATADAYSTCAQHGPGSERAATGVTYYYSSRK